MDAPIQLRLEYVSGLVLEPLSHTFVEASDLGGILGRIQGQHGDGVLRVGKHTLRLGTHPLGRRIHGDQVGI